MFFIIGRDIHVLIAVKRSPERIYIAILTSARRERRESQALKKGPALELLKMGETYSVSDPSFSLTRIMINK
jgi:hypothetical protein